MTIFKSFLCFNLILAIAINNSLAQNPYGKDFYDQISDIIGYNISVYKEKHMLDKELQEISGLSYYKKDQLACVEDEDGELYIYDLKAKKIIQTIKFGKKGDYEGVETIGKEIFVLRSDGTVFNFSMRDAPDVKTVSWKTPLSSKDDVEGLGYTSKDKTLLLACKEKTEIGDQKSKGKAIYPFDVKIKQLLPSPFLDIDTKALNHFLASKKTKYKTIKHFKPSAVAVHPKTQQTFVIASVGKLMVILNKDGDLEQVIPLDPKIYKQPEGICFAPNATMYISSEGQDGKGYILEFPYR